MCKQIKAWIEMACGHERQIKLIWHYLIIKCRCPCTDDGFLSLSLHATNEKATFVKTIFVLHQQCKNLENLENLKDNWQILDAPVQVS